MFEGMAEPIFLYYVACIFCVIGFILLPISLVNIKQKTGKVLIYISLFCFIPISFFKIMEIRNNIDKWNSLGPFFQAIEKQKIEKIKRLIKEGYGVNENNLYVRPSPSTPLSYAVYKGKLRSVQILVEQGADVNLIPDNGDSPLEEAVFKGNVAIVNYLLEQGADVSLRSGSNSDYPFPIESAVNNPSANKDIVEALLKHGADPNCNNCKPVINAIQNYNYEIVRCLLEHSANVDSCMPRLKRQAQYMRNIRYADSVQVFQIIKLLEEYTPKRTDIEF